MAAGASERLQSQEPDDESVETRIRRCIRAGRFVPGQRLVEVDLMELFNVSQRQVRDALRRLESEGLVLIEKNRGATVRKISRKEVECILDVLDSLSLLAVGQAVKNADDPQNRATLEASLTAAQVFRRQVRAEKKVQKYLDENVRFWDSIASVVDNPILWDIRERLETLLFRLQVQGLTINSNPEMWITHHEEILSAILSREIKRAERLVLKASKDVREAILGLDDDVFN
jgi:DNA-binding GntR family transcriptional regulator